MGSFGRSITVLICACAMMACEGERGGTSPIEPASVTAVAPAVPAPLPDTTGLTVAAERELAAADARYAPQPDEGGVLFAAPDDSGRTRASFGHDGARIELGTLRATVRGSAIGRAGRMRRLDEALPTTNGPEVQMDRGGVTEWWRSLPSGLEHGFTVATRPEGAGDLVIEARFTGVSTHRRTDAIIELLDADGALVGSYSQLSVVDADGTSVEARMSATAEGVRIEIDDDAARYPLVVDPMFRSAMESSVGNCADMTPDGTRMVLNSGAVYVRSGTTWSLEQTLSVPSGSTASISDDGGRAVFGTASGQFYTFDRSGSSWGAATMSPEPSAYAYPVELNGDGSRLIVALSNFYSYTYSAGSWVAGPTVAGSCSNADMQSDGLRVVVSGYVSSTATSIVRVWSGSAWTDEGTVGAGGATSMTSDGTRVGVSSGIWARSGSTWTQELTIANGCRIAKDGTRAICGSSNQLYLRSGTTWTVDATLSSAFDFGGTRFCGPSGIFRIDPALSSGNACGSSADCLSGYCVDGYCCASRCNGVCEACSMAQTGVANGTCAPYSASVAPTVECRSASTVCDVPEQCVAGTNVCPTDRFASSTTSCHTHTAGSCDADARCTGTSATCPSPPSAAGLPCHTRSTTPGNCDADAACDGVGLTCPDTHAPTTTVCRTQADLCDAAEYCPGNSDTCPAVDARQPMGFACRPSQGGCDIPEYCPGGAALCPTDVFLSMGASCMTGMTGGACSLGGTCNGTSPTCSTGGFRPSGTVCNPRDPANPCDVDDTCNGTDDICRPSYAPASTTCVATAMSGACDAVDHCSGVSTACVDAIQASGTLCRAAVPGGCDVAETCDGTSHACPMDTVQPNGVICRDYQGICDQQELCDGMSNACPADARRPATYECRPSAGACDRAELCDGFGVSCPSDALLAPGAACGSAGAACVTGGSCNGSAPECQGGTLRPLNTICHLHDPANPCELDSVCNGVDDVCAPRFAAATTACGPPASGACDAPDHCAGTSADCVATFTTGVVCRPAAGGCDSPESCSGSAADCPPDDVESAGMVCRAAATSCDVAEMCDGLTNACPADLMSCDGGIGAVDGGMVGTDAGPTPDAGGTDGGGAVDGGGSRDGSAPTGDAGSTPPIDGGCACTVPSPHERHAGSALTWLVLGLGLALRFRPRRAA